LSSGAGGQAIELTAGWHAVCVGGSARRRSRPIETSRDLKWGSIGATGKEYES